MGDPLSTSVSKEPRVNLRQFLVEDLDPVASTDDVSLKETSRELVQCFLNDAWKLPVEREHDLLIAKLPVEASSSVNLPREKPVPTSLPKTKWERFAAVKGIKNRKRDNKVWDEAAQEWKPRWGYGRANDDTKDWLVEIPDQAANPNDDYFEKRSEAKKQRVAKNQLQQLRNLKRMQKSTAPAPDGDEPTTASTTKKRRPSNAPIKSKKQKRTLMKEQKTLKKNRSRGKQ